MQWKWSATQTSPGKWYAQRHEKVSRNKYKWVLMHRVITNAPAGFDVDHRDGDGLHNWRSNLRVCTHSQNTQNRKLASNNTSGYKGACLKRGRWVAQIRHAGQYQHLGHFNSAEEAARAYDTKAKELFGEFARLNFEN